VALALLQPTFVLDSGQAVDNPIGVAALPHPEESAAGTALTTVLLATVLAAFGSLILRFRRSRGEERQQLKWFTYAAALVPFVALGDLLPEAVGNLLFAALTVFPPVAAGIAILRYRLYEIDRLINRTLVYGLVTAVLAGVYSGLVFLLGNLLNPADGRSELAVAASTLAVAALFGPARRRSRRWWTAASTGPAMTPPGPWRRSAPGSATRSTWTPSPRSCWGWSTAPCSRPRRRCGSDPDRGRP
jgi:hypothetical protein